MSSILDTLIIVILLIVMSIGCIFAYQVFNQVNTDIAASDMDDSAKTISSDLYSNFPKLFDNLILFAFILLSLVVVVSVFLIDTHPALMLFSLILLVAVFVVCALLSNSFTELMSDQEISTFANSFPNTAWIMQHFVEEMIIISFLVMMALFAKSRI